jgi:hypothetical protein
MSDTTRVLVHVDLCVLGEKDARFKITAEARGAVRRKFPGARIEHWSKPRLLSSHYQSTDHDDSGWYSWARVWRVGEEQPIGKLVRRFVAEEWSKQTATTRVSADRAPGKPWRCACAACRHQRKDGEQ